MADERKLEIQVGALILAGVAALVGLFWLMGELRGARGPELTVLLGHTGNVATGAPVKLGGVEVGRVEEIRLDPSRRDEAGEPLPVALRVSVREDVRRTLHQDAQVMIATRGPLGEAYLELHPGTQGAPPLPDEAVLRGHDAARLDLIAARMSKLMEGAARTLEDNPEALANLLRGVSKLSHSAGDVLADNRAELRALITELGGAAAELKQLATHANAQLGPGGKTAALIDDASASARVLRRELPALSENAGRALAGLSAVSGELDAEDGKRLKLALERYTSAGQKLDQIAARGERLLARIEAGEGTVGGLVKEDQLYKDIRDLVAELKKHPWKLVWKQ